MERDLFLTQFGLVLLDFTAVSSLLLVVANLFAQEAISTGC